MSQINPSQPITDLYGDPVMLEPGRPFTFGRAVQMALTRILPGEERKSGRDDHEHDWFMLAGRIVEAERNGGTVDLSAQETVWIKDRAKAMFTDLTVMGRIWEMVEPSGQ